MPVDSTPQEHPFKREDATAMGPFLVSEDPPLYLSAVDFSDMDEMIRVLNINKDIYNGTSSFQFPYTEEHAHARITRAVNYTTMQGFNTHWAMRTSPTGPLVGWIAHYFVPSDPLVAHPETGRPLKLADLGYWVSPEHTRKGYASKSARFVTQEILFKIYEVDIVRAEAYTHNIASQKVLQHAGMRREVDEKTVFMAKLNKDMVISCFAVHREPSTHSIITSL